MADPKLIDPIDDLRRSHPNREPVTPVRRWIPWTPWRAITAGTLDPPPVNLLAADLIVPIIGSNQLEIVISQPAAGGVSNLNPVTGELEDITSWSARLWLAGGRYNPNLAVPVDELLWSDVNGANFVGMGSRSFCEHFNCSAYYMAMFQVYDIVGVGTLYLSMRPS